MRSSYFRICFAGLVFSLCVVPTARARLVQIITYDELWRKSDLVVIAQPTTKTTNTNEVNYLLDIVQTDASGKENKVAAIGVETTFNVIKILKGNNDIKQFILHHYRETSWPSPSPVELGGPNLVSFDPSDPARRRDILLFLLREKDGRYAPYGGQTDPGLHAIFALETPP